MTASGESVAPGDDGRKATNQSGTGGPSPSGRPNWLSRSSPIAPRQPQVADVVRVTGGDHLASPDPHQVQVPRVGGHLVQDLGLVPLDQVSIRIGLAGTICGRIRCPPLARAAYAFSSWSGVTAMTF